MSKSPSASEWCRFQRYSVEYNGGEPAKLTMGTCSARAPAMPLSAGELTHAIGRQQRANTRLAAVAIGSVSSVELITRADEFDVLSASLICSMKLEVEISGHTDDVFNPHFFQPPNDEFTHGSVHRLILNFLAMCGIILHQHLLCCTSLSKSLDKKREFLRRMSKCARL